MKAKPILAALLLSSTAALAQPSVTTAGNKYVLIEECTGAWCGYCPDGGYILEGILATTPKTIAISIHDNINTIRGDQTSMDMMEPSDGTGYDFTHATGYGGYPSAGIDRIPNNFTGNVSQNKDSWAYYTTFALGNTPKFDVTLLHAYNAATSTLTVWVYAKTLAAVTGKYNINAVVTEDSIASIGAGYEQHSSLFRNTASTFYHKGTPNADSSVAILGPADYAHMHVLRSYLGGTFGDAGVIDDNSAAGKTYAKKYTFAIPASYKKKHLHIVGMVQKYNATDVNDRAVDNAIEARFDSTAVQTAVADIAGNIGNIDIFPNPATNNLQLTASTGNVEDINVTITNVVGQPVLSHTMKLGGTLSENLDISLLSNGIYFVNLSCNGSVVTKKLVVVK